MILIILIKIRRIYQFFSGTDEVSNTDDNQERMRIIFPREDNNDILIIIRRR